MISSFDWTTFTKPTGTPMISSGFKKPSSISSYSLTRAVGAFPTAKISGFERPAALSILAVARVVPFFLAFCATSSSDIKQYTSPPYRANAFLLIPAFAIWVSVTIQAPFLIASRACCTAPSENFRF